jgi:hypothetical protein
VSPNEKRDPVDEPLMTPNSNITSENRGKKPDLKIKTNLFEPTGYMDLHTSVNVPTEKVEGVEGKRTKVTSHPDIQKDDTLE